MPKNWKTYKLGDLIKIKHGYAFKGDFFTNIINENVLLTPGNFHATGGIKFNWEKQKFYEGTVPKDYILNKNDLILALTDLTQSCDILGSPAIIKDSNYYYLHNQRLGLVNILSGELDKIFLFYYFNHSNFRNRVIATKTGSTVSHTAPERIYECELALPPLPEQRAIASILSDLDDKIELNLQMNKTLEEMAMALYKHWFVDFGPFKDCEFVESEMGMIPKGWEVKRLGDIIEVVNGFAFKGVDFCEEGIPVLKIKNVKPGKILFENMAFVNVDKTIKALRAKIAFRDILITMSGNRMAGSMDSWVGKVAMFPRTGDYYLNQRVSKIHINSNDEFLRDYLSIMLSSEEFQYYFIKNSTSSGGQANISPDLIKEIKIIHPPVDVLLKFQKIVKLYFEKRAFIDIENQTLIKQRDSLLPKLISGEIRVKDLEKN